MTNPTRKKVLFLITKSNWGGAQRYVYDLATHLDQAKYEPVVALGGNGQLNEQLIHAHIRTIKIPSLERNISLKKEWEFARELWNILSNEKPDIFHVNSSKAGAMGALLGRIRFVQKIVFTSHGWAFNEDRPWLQKAILKFIHWLTVILSHRTIAVSRAIVEEMDWPFLNQKMTVVNPGRTIGVMYGKKESREELSRLNPELGKHVNDFWLGQIAELHPIKRQNVLIDSMHKLTGHFPKLRLVIIGEGEERDRLAQQISDYNLQKNVFLLGSITEAARFLKAFDLFVLTSKSESYGYVVHEAGLAGLPVVTTNVGGLTDIVEDGQTGLLVPYDDVQETVKAINKYLENNALRKEHAQRHKEKMVVRSLEKMVKATTAIYEL